MPSQLHGKLTWTNVRIPAFPLLSQLALAQLLALQDLGTLLRRTAALHSRTEVGRAARLWAHTRHDEWSLRTHSSWAGDREHGAGPVARPKFSLKGVGSTPSPPQTKHAGARGRSRRQVGPCFPFAPRRGVTLAVGFLYLIVGSSPPRTALISSSSAAGKGDCWDQGRVVPPPTNTKRLFFSSPDASGPGQGRRIGVRTHWGQKPNWG